MWLVDGCFEQPSSAIPSLPPSLRPLLLALFFSPSLLSLSSLSFCILFFSLLLFISSAISVSPSLLAYSPACVRAEHRALLSGNTTKQGEHMVQRYRWPAGARCYLSYLIVVHLASIQCDSPGQTDAVLLLQRLLLCSGGGLQLCERPLQVSNTS